MNKPKKIDPNKATPQAPRALRAGSKGAARAAMAASMGKPAPGEEPDDDEDDKEEDASDVKAPDGEADKGALADCAATCDAAAEACTAAAEQLTAQAAELRSGVDSLSSLVATEAACTAADEALDACTASMAALRGAEPPADEPEPGPMDQPTDGGQQPAPAMRATMTTEAHIVSERLKTFALYALGRLGLTAADTVKAQGVLGGKLDLAARAAVALKSEATTRAAADQAKRIKLWEDAVTDGRVQMAQAFAREDGPPDAAGEPTTVRVYATWAKAQNAAYAELPAFEAWISSRVPEPGSKGVSPSTMLADQGAAKREAFALDEHGKREARRAGIDPALLLAQLAAQQKTQNGAAGAGERA